MKISNHPLQSFEWGKFREKTGMRVVRRDGFQLTIHKIAYTSWNIGYLPKGLLPTKEMVNELIKIGKQENCIFIQLEPDMVRNQESGIRNYGKDIKTFESLIHNSKFIILNSFHPLFTKYTFWIDLTKSEEELLSGMHPKTRYNIKVAQKHGVQIVEDNSQEAFEIYIKLTKETTRRQRFYAHSEEYHRLMWETLKVESGKLKVESYDRNKLSAHLLVARYQPKSNSQLSTLNSQFITLAAWILFVFKDTLYYPYGASSNESRETMASNLMMWEAIKFGKKLGLKKFDLWGALGPNPDKNDPWYGFHRFKEGYGGDLVEFIGSYDLVINPFLYQLYKIADKVRWGFLQLRKRF